MLLVIFSRHSVVMPFERQGLATFDQTVVFIDAENTLWDTNRVYADAQLSLLANVESAVGRRTSAADRLGWLRQIDQALAERHHARLRYPPRLLAKAIALALKGQDIAAAARIAWSGARATVPLNEEIARRIENSFVNALNTLPLLRVGVEQGLRALHEANCLILVLNRQKVLAILEHYGLRTLVKRIIEAPKEQRLFHRVLALTHRPAKAFMIGDQLDRDIAPAKAAGLITIYFPGGFQPKWHPAEGEIKPDYSVQDFTQAADFVLSGTNEECRSARAS